MVSVGMGPQEAVTVLTVRQAGTRQLVQMGSLEVMVGQLGLTVTPPKATLESRVSRMSTSRSAELTYPEKIATIARMVFML